MLLLAVALVITGFGAIFVGAADAAPENQVPIYTRTPGPDGQIIWVVKANDTLLSISIISGIPVEEIISMNNLTTETIFEGQQLVLGLGGPAEETPTPGPTPTPTEPLPTFTPQPGFGTLCIILFDDRDGDSIRQEIEESIPNGAISLADRSGAVSESTTTGSGLDYQCFEDLPEGDYMISVAIPEGYNPTTESDFEIGLNAGDETFINFGAQANAETLAQEQIVPAPEGGRSPILGIIGIIFLVGGVVVAFLALRGTRSSRTRQP